MDKDTRRHALLNNGALVRYDVVTELDEEQKSKFMETMALANKNQFESEGQIVVTSAEMRNDILDKKPLPPLPKPEPVEVEVPIDVPDPLEEVEDVED